MQMNRFVMREKIRMMAVKNAIRGPMSSSFKHHMHSSVKFFVLFIIIVEELLSRAASAILEFLDRLKNYIDSYSNETANLFCLNSVNNKTDSALWLCIPLHYLI